MPRFTRKPTTVEAIVFKGRRIDDKELFRKLARVRYTLMGQDRLMIHTLTGMQPVHPGDYVVFGTHDTYPVKPEVFESTYDAVIQA